MTNCEGILYELYNKQHSQGCYYINFIGRSSFFVGCVACKRLNEDCRYLRGKN